MNAVDFSKLDQKVIFSLTESLLKTLTTFCRSKKQFPNIPHSKLTRWLRGMWNVEKTTNQVLLLQDLADHRTRSSLNTFFTFHRYNRKKTCTSFPLEREQPVTSNTRISKSRIPCEIASQIKYPVEKLFFSGRIFIFSCI